MKKEIHLPFRSLRDVVLKELQADSVLTWNGDSSYTDHILPSLLASEAYLLDESACDYLEDLSSGLSVEDYYRALANTRMPFGTVWIEFVGMSLEDDGAELSLEKCSDGALITDTPDGIRVFTATMLHDVKPWRVVYSGTEVTFHRDGEVSCSKTPISKLYDRLAAAKGISAQAMLNRDIDTALRIGGVFAVLCAALDRPRILDRKEPRPPRKSEAKAHMQASREAPAYGMSVIRLSKAGWAERVASAAEHAPGGEKSSRAAHWVRGHMFLARNGKLTWRRSHVRGTGPTSARLHHVTE